MSTINHAHAPGLAPVIALTFPLSLNHKVKVTQSQTFYCKESRKKRARVKTIKSDPLLQGIEKKRDRNLVQVSSLLNLLLKHHANSAVASRMVTNGAGLNDSVPWEWVELVQ